MAFSTFLEIIKSYVLVAEPTELLQVVIQCLYLTYHMFSKLLRIVIEPQIDGPGLRGTPPTHPDYIGDFIKEFFRVSGVLAKMDGIYYSIKNNNRSKSRLWI